MDKTTAPKISGAKLLWIDEFRLLAHVFGVFQNEYASHPGRWSAEARAQLDAALAPDWPGLASKAAIGFKRRSPPRSPPPSRSVRPPKM